MSRRLSDHIDQRAQAPLDADSGTFLSTRRRSCEKALGNIGQRIPPNAQDVVAASCNPNDIPKILRTSHTVERLWREWDIGMDDGIQRRRAMRDIYNRYSQSVSSRINNGYTRHKILPKPMQTEMDNGSNERETISKYNAMVKEGAVGKAEILSRTQSPPGCTRDWNGKETQEALDLKTICDLESLMTCVVEIIQ